MLHHRCLLEVVGWLPARDVALSAVIVSREWQKVADEDELWLVLAEASSFILTREVPSETNKQRYKHLMEARYVLPIVTANQVSFFHVVSKRRIVHRLSASITVDFSSFSVFLSDGSLLVCGGGSTKSPWDSAYRVFRGGRVESLPNMSTGRRAPGSALYNREAYVFGGYGLITCEKLNLDGPAPLWTNLSAMVISKCEFTPCVYAHLIYLCGGGTDPALYDPSLDVFREFKVKCLERCFVAQHEESLLIVTTGEIKTFDFHRQTMKVESHSQWGYGGVCVQPVLHSGCVWVTLSKAVLRLSLSTLETDIFE